MCVCALYVVSAYKWYCYKVVIKYQYKNTGYHLKSQQSKIPSSLTVEILTGLSLDLDRNFYIKIIWQIGYIVFGHIHFIKLSLYGNGFRSVSFSFRRRQWHPTPVLLPGKSHGRRSLVGCSPWGREKSDTTERLHFHFSLSCIGEENGSLLQCPCLENPRDGGAWWWAAVYGVTQSQTPLKQLNSSSSILLYLLLMTQFSIYWCMKANITNLLLMNV